MTEMESPVRRENANTISLRRGGESLGVSESVWRELLAAAVPDERVGIRHQAITGDSAYRTHVAAIPKQVGCHYHSRGDEDYAVVEGEGILFFGRTADGQVPPDSWRSIKVRAGDSFVIPEGFAHQLRKTGDGDLTIVFGCPDSHLNDDMDRFMLPDAPKEVDGLSADNKKR
jgi:mannose-6-phosphate isomerase-like protein (cupin superfamily)